MKLFCVRVGLGGESYISIMKPTVFCDSINQAASYWFSIPHNRNFSRELGGVPPWSPSCYATECHPSNAQLQEAEKPRTQSLRVWDHDNSETLGGALIILIGRCFMTTAYIYL